MVAMSEVVEPAVALRVAVWAIPGDGRGRPRRPSRGRAAPGLRRWGNERVA